MSAIIHLRNGRAARHPTTFGGGATWCGKKLLDKPQVNEDGTETFTSYGAELIVSFDPAQGTCARCREAFDAAYNEAFPEGLKPIATFRIEDAAEVERAKALLSPNALRQFFGPGGGGMAAFKAAVAASNDKDTPTNV